MSFWNKVKQFFGAGEAPEGPAKTGDALSAHDAALVREVSAIIQIKCQNGELFQAVDVADQGGYAAKGIPQIRAACAVVEALHDTGRFDALGYTRTDAVYHPVGASPDSYVRPRAAALGSPPAPAPRPAPVAQPAPVSAVRQADAKDPLDGGDILGLSAEDFRKRALKINPYRTAWIGRVDTIPPQSDERTALIDRGLILRGMLKPEQITEIHRVGDLWLKHHDAMRIAEIAAQKNADAFLEARRAEKAALKEQKKREADERRAKRKAEIAQRRATDIVFLGRGVSAGLADRRTHIEELARRGLPILSTPQDVAKALGLDVPRLRWLAFHAEAPARTHYVHFEIPKRSGGTRLLSAPHDDLKKAQHWILEFILSKLPVTEAAHGFVPGRSTVTNARMHVGRDVVVNCDLKDFFPSITFKRVRGVFEVIGYSPAVSTILALLCTEAPRTKVVHEGREFWVAVGERALPQGAPTSPALSNQIARKLDQRLEGVCKKIGWSYTRYADDLTFSAESGQRERIGWLLARVRHIAQNEGFALNAKKTRVQRNARRQDVTGVVVNDKPATPREEIRRLRAILHGAKRTGLEGQNRQGHPAFEAYVRGKIAYVSMIDREKGEKLRRELDVITGS
ncbi:Retron-type RNA-directed DNA polymerase [Labilithrix luteola]|uniref:RNA-directed DNA polymerase n=1 Tax=Labilithrix luteola TaxID=1391654 RepID=A0A0K1PTJ9_9BACT|nr:reverse transcriptase family protein [Labilithrix luteola]AKU96855.1 Retron-type RNA-directed DNA polymerase [Labilithrix luteola]